MDCFSTDTERHLLDMVAEGDQTAFTQLFRRYSDITYGFAVAYTKTEATAEEVVQEVYLKIWLDRERLKDIQSFKDHLFIVTRNYLIDYLRKKLREQEYRRQLARHFRETTTTPHEEFLLKESQERIGKAVERLPPRQQAVYRLRRHEGLPVTEIALKMNISRLTVRNHLNKALGAIREYLQS